MDITTLIAANPLTWLIPVAVWAILFVVIWDTLRTESPFGGFASFAIAVAASLLAVVGMLGTLFGTESEKPTAASEDGPSGFLLLPYTAMGISILVVLLLLLLAKLFGFGRQGPREGEKADLAGAAKASRMREIEPESRRHSKGDRLTR